MSATAFSGIFPIDVPLPGSKMRLRDTSGPDGKRTYAALRHGTQSVPVPDPRITGATASIGRVGAGEVTVLDLPASGWSAGTSVRRGFEFKSRSGAVVSARIVESRYIRILGAGRWRLSARWHPAGRRRHHHRRWRRALLRLPRRHHHEGRRRRDSWRGRLPPPRAAPPWGRRPRPRRRPRRRTTTTTTSTTTTTILDPCESTGVVSLNCS